MNDEEALKYGALMFILLFAGFIIIFSQPLTGGPGTFLGIKVDIVTVIGIVLFVAGLVSGGYFAHLMGQNEASKRPQ